MSRVLAVLIAAGYLCAGALFGGLVTALSIAPFLCLLLACIIRPEYLAEPTKWRKLSLPEGLLAGLAWFVLILPVILTGVVWLML